MSTVACCAKAELTNQKPSSIVKRFNTEIYGLRGKHRDVIAGLRSEVPHCSSILSTGERRKSAVQIVARQERKGVSCLTPLGVDEPEIYGVLAVIVPTIPVRPSCTARRRSLFGGTLSTSKWSRIPFCRI